MDSERNFNGSADPVITADRGLWARILDFGCLEVRIVDLNVAPESSLSLSYVPMSRSGETD